MLSVISNTKCSFPASYLFIFSITSFITLLFAICTNERLICITNWGIIFTHSLHWAAAVSIIHLPNGIISELSSSSGINSTGDIKPYWSLFHLKSASAPSILPVSASTIGW